MFTDHQLKWRAIISLSAIVAVATWTVMLVLQGHSPELSSVFRIGTVTLAVWIAWRVLVQVAWRWRWVRIGGWLVATPDLNGTWYGSSVSSFDNIPREMTLRIRQNLLYVRPIAYGPDNVAEGFSARILSDRDETVFKLAYLYRAERQPTTSIPGDEHPGVALLTLNEQSGKRTLNGFYVNARDPQPRKAQIDLTWVSPETEGGRWIPPEQNAVTTQDTYRDREKPHSSPLPHHAAYGSVLRGSADQASSTPGERKPK